jgi:MFS family permease
VYTSWAAFLNWINALLLDRVGRKPVIIIGLSGCIAMITIYTAMVAEYAGTSNRVGNAMGTLLDPKRLAFH